MNELILKLNTEIKEEEVAKRAQDQKRNLKIRRIILEFFSFLLLVAGWIIIYLGSIYENEMQDWINEKLGVEIQFVADWSATLAMTVVNYIVPYFIGILSELQ